MSNITFFEPKGPFYLNDLSSDAPKDVKKIRHISIANIFGDAIKAINSNSSVSALFD